ncbi:MAG: T9SS type A sorting domain-containing protein [Bacteroidales bacterium]
MKKTLALLLIIVSVSTNTFAQSCLSSVIFDSLNNVILSNQTIQLNLERPSILLSSKTFAPGSTNSYVFDSIPFNPPCSFNLIEYPGRVECMLPWDDVWGEVLSLDLGQPITAPPFIFSFYGQNNLSQFVVGSNGVLSWDLTQASGSGFINPSHTCSFSAGILIPSTNAEFLNCIFAPYHDIYFKSDQAGWGKMYFYIAGDYPCRRLILSFYQVPLYISGEAQPIEKKATHMIVLYETTNTIEFYLENKPCTTSTNEGKATLGIQNATGTQATFITNAAGLDYNNTIWSATNEAWRIRPEGDLSYSTQWYKRPTSGTDRIMLNSTNGSILACPDSIEGAQYYIMETSIIRTDGNIIIISDSCLVRPQTTLHVINITDTICNGDTYNLNGFNESTTGVYTQNLLTTQGYDSIVNLNLIVNEVTTPTNLTLDNVENYLKLSWYGDSERYAIYKDNDSLCVITTKIFKDTNVVDGLNYCYQVKAIDGECESEKVEICNVFIGLNEITNNNDISIILYPNPTTGNTILEVEGLTSSAEVFVYDITGRIVKNYNLQANQTELNIDLSGFAKGVYQVKVLNQTKKLIVN